MDGVEVNRISRTLMVGLSVFVLCLVLTGFLEGPQRDENAAAHFFQIAIVALVPTGLMFLTTADWKRPRRVVPPLAVSALAVVLAFGTLYYLEHVYWQR